MKLSIFGKGVAQATKASPMFHPRPGTPATDDAGSTEEAVGQTKDDEAEPKDKRAVPDEINGEMTPAAMVATSKRAANRHVSRTVSSPIPAMLAETMDLAGENDAVPRALPQVTSPRR